MFKKVFYVLPIGCRAGGVQMSIKKHKSEWENLVILASMHTLRTLQYSQMVGNRL